MRDGGESLEVGKREWWRLWAKLEIEESWLERVR